YEPLWLTAEAGPERVAQRDSFWSGVVLYREKRWAEAYNEFQKARGSETEDDPALEFYLRRLETPVLQVKEWPGGKSRGRVEKDGISGGDPGLNCTTATDAGRRSALGGADRALDGADARRSTCANCVRHH